MKKLFKSRTVWMFIALIVINVIPAIKDQLPSGWLPIINIVLPILGIYFRAKPKQNLGGMEKVLGDLAGQIGKGK